MAYDERLAGRVRDALEPLGRIGEIKMFGGLCFTHRGNMVVGVVRDDLMVRLHPDDHDKAMKRPGARPMDFTKRPMQGFLFVGPSGYKGRALETWIAMASEYVSTLPPKKAKKSRAKAVRQKTHR